MAATIKGRSKINAQEIKGPLGETCGFTFVLVMKEAKESGRIVLIGPEWRNILWE